MKKVLLTALVAVATLSLTSCYNTRILVGNVEPTEPLVEVNKVWNHGIIFGLVPLQNATMKASQYVDNADNYVVKTNQKLPEHAGFRSDFRYLYPDADQILHPAQGCPEIGNQPF